MLIIFVMVQMRRCSDNWKLRSSIDLLNLFQFLSRVVKVISKYKIAHVKFKSSKKKLIKLRVNAKLYLKKYIFSFSSIVFMFYFSQNINVSHTFKSIKNAYHRYS